MDILPDSSNATFPPQSEKNRGISGVLFGITGVFTGLILLILVFLILNYFNILSLSTFFPKQLGFLSHQSSNSSSPMGEKLINSKPEDAIAKVGNEYIYQQDLDTELSNYPSVPNVDTKKLLLQKIAKDSIILQAGQKEGLVQLDSSIFNSSQKDYNKRLAMVKQVQNAITNRHDSISGSVVSLWFFNDKAGAVGYDKGKQIAESTITPLYNEVKSNKLTMQQAAQKIQNNTALAQVDLQYKTNALLTFKVGPTERITFDPGFDALIQKLEPDQLTPLYLAKDRNLAIGQMVDAVYMFAQVSEKKANGQTEDFNQWYAQQQKIYEITIY